MSLIKKLFGDTSSSFIAKNKGFLKKIADLEESIIALKDEDFPKKTLEFKDKLKNGTKLEDILPEAFALVREAAKRCLNERHYDVQLIGGMALNAGKIAEMKTGEGKTLVATLSAYLNALEGKGVHVITVNDYLARRDAVLMGQVYNFLGLSVGIINSQNVSYLYDEKHLTQEEEKIDDENRDKTGEFKIVYDFLKPSTRKQAYEADITYGTNHEYGFDYLRDNLATSASLMVQRGQHYAIVDEVDSILIDEARTPLIISTPAEESDEFYRRFAEIAKGMARDEDYTVDEKLKAIQLTQNGITKAESALGIDNIYTEKGIKYVHHLETAVKARAIFERDRDYVLKDGEVVIVDPFTGRMQPGRRWSEGVHQAIEAKEGVKIEKETRSAGSITYQNYFRMYKKLSGMTGTAETSAEEFLKVYGLDVIVIPTHRPVSRIDRSDLIFQTEQGKFKAIAQKIKELSEKGQPVLVGTISIEKNELLSEYLKALGVKHTILNAKNHEQEGEIIAQAGRYGAVTIATNMAGRGIDIKLGGNPIVKEEYEKVKAVGGLYVLGTERHEARRIDNQLRGRSGRQGDPGETQFFVSLEDDLMRVFGADRIKNMMGRFGIPEDQPITNGMVNRTLEGAQAKIEGFHFDSRKHTLEYDDVMNHQRRIVYERRQKMLLADREEMEKLLANLANDFEGFAEAEKEKREKLGEENFFETVRRIALYTNDTLWMEHLEQMDYLRSSVNLRAYGQREPIVEYKKEGLHLFKAMESAFRMQVADLIRNINIENAQNLKVEVEKPKQTLILNQSEAKMGGIKNNDKAEVGRNDMCPCGSGKKYKKCHGA